MPEVALVLCLLEAFDGLGDDGDELLLCENYAQGLLRITSTNPMEFYESIPWNFINLMES